MTMTFTPEPGIYPGIPAEEYFSWPAVSNSDLTFAARSMAHYRYAPPLVQTPAMRFGSIVHAGFLEPETFERRYCAMPAFEDTIRKPDGSEYANPKATNAYKAEVEAWRDAHPDVEVVTSDEMRDAKALIASLEAHTCACAYLRGDGPAEVSLVWDDPGTGIRCKARVDKINESACLLADLKTTVDAADFERSLAKYRYHRQAAFYREGYMALTGTVWPFAIVAVEKDVPYGVRAAVVAEEAIDVGQREYQRLLEQIAECRRTGVWPGYEDPPAWTLPGWYVASAGCDDEPQLTFNGEPITC